MSLLLTLHPAELALAPRAEPQLCYALVTVAADAGGGATPVSWAVVADASRSMRIPIVSEEQFRELVRSGGAQEVLVDGVPVWQLTGPVPEEVRAVAPSALDHTARALHSIVERLDRADRLCLVACAEQALLLVAAGGERRAELVAGVARLRSLRLGEETDLAAGMRVALAELRRGGEGVRRLVLLTDGFTRDPEDCLALAREAAAQGVSVSTLGLGGEFQDDLLTRMADLSGGRAAYLRRAEQIPAAVAAELDAARGVAARALTLELALPRGAALRYATRISPTLAPLEWEPGGPGGRRLTLRLGDLERGAPARLLLEILAPPLPPRPAPGGPRVRLAALTATSGKARAVADIVAHYTPLAGPPSPATLAAAARASTARLQRRAAEAAARGDAQSAAALLRAAAERLRDLGEPGLVEAAMREAAALAATGRDTGAGARELTYATRRLGEHEVPG
ncbi:MAG TPA: VWA domain-containing protein [Chloroflexaceae bacterium]|nr:VWA domain-containing protein [Chloroflexaceae bacterium]